MLLRELPNIGKTLAERLEVAGIRSVEQLLQVGSREAFRQLRSIDEGACVNTLYALEGAVQGIRWHLLSDVDKQALHEHFRRECGR